MCIYVLCISSKTKNKIIYNINFRKSENRTSIADHRFKFGKNKRNSQQHRNTRILLAEFMAS